MNCLTPPSLRSEPQTQSRSCSRISKLQHYSEDQENGSPNLQISLDIVPSSSSPQIVSTFSSKPPYTVPLRELLLVSPSSSPSTLRSKTRLAERFQELADEASESNNGRKLRKSRNSSPRNIRKARKKSEQDSREEREFGLGDEVLVKPRKKKNSVRAKKDKLNSIPSSQSPIDGEVGNFERIGDFVEDLIMWRDVSKSSLWFGFGSLCFLSSCLTKGVNFSTFSCISHVGLLFLGLSFLSYSLRPREANEVKVESKLTEDDILKFGKLILPLCNIVNSKARRIFSGEPTMTLKVVPFFLLGAEYGHFITPWRLSAICFFISFTAPKLYSTYSLSNKVEYVLSRVFEVWGACKYKKIVAASIVTAFWNLTSVRTRVFAAFLCLVLIRYRREQSSEAKKRVHHDGISEEGKQEQEQHIKEPVAVEIESKN